MNSKQAQSTKKLGTTAGILIVLGVFVGGLFIGFTSGSDMILMIFMCILLPISILYAFVIHAFFATLGGILEEIVKTNELLANNSASKSDNSIDNTQFIESQGTVNTNSQ